MITSVSALRGRFRGQQVIVLASGATVDHISPRLFDSGPVIGINDVWKHHRCDFVVTHHPECCQPVLDAKRCTLVTSQYAHGEIKYKSHYMYAGDYYEYQTYPTNRTGPVDLRPIVNEEYDKLVISYNTVSEGINLAWLMGAHAILLCGVDGGTIDGRLNYDGYNGGHGTRPEDIRSTYQILRDVVAAVRAKGVAVGSYNPFLDLTLEGHIYESLVAAVPA